MSYCIKVNDFEGPLDLLLHLVNKADIDIWEININEITEQYLDYINKWQELDIDIASEYLVMAATLIEIKSKSLLPQDKTLVEEDDPEEISREGLIAKLVEYQRYKEVTKDFKQLEASRREIYAKAPSKLNEIVETKLVNDTEVGADDLIMALASVLERKNMEKPVITRVANKEYSVKKRKQAIKSYLAERGRAEFGELFKVNSRGYVIVTFLSILELAKEEEVNLTQEGNFEKIFIELKVK